MCRLTLLTVIHRLSLVLILRIFSDFQLANQEIQKTATPSNVRWIYMYKDSNAVLQTCTHRVHSPSSTVQQDLTTLTQAVSMCMAW